jgi:hypothetical protein
LQDGKQLTARRDSLAAGVVPGAVSSKVAPGRILVSRLINKKGKKGKKVRKRKNGKNDRLRGLRSAIFAWQ